MERSHKRTWSEELAALSESFKRVRFENLRSQSLRRYILAAIFLMLLFVMGMRLGGPSPISFVLEKNPDEDFLRISFNISFPALSCEFAAVDVSNVLGMNELNLTTNVRKYPIDANLKQIGAKFQPVPISNAVKFDDEEFGDGSPWLTEDNFNRVSQTFSILVINFYASWSAACINQMPSWEEAARITRERYPLKSGRILLGRVDCNEDADFCSRLRIESYPSVYIFRRDANIKQKHDIHEVYQGNKDAYSLINAMDYLMAPMKSQTLERLAPEGCQIEGIIRVQKVPGDLVFSARSHDFDVSDMNLSHVISHFSFGMITPHVMSDIERVLPRIGGSVDKLRDKKFITFPFDRSSANISIEHYLQIHKTEVMTWSHRSVEAYVYTAHSWMHASSPPAAIFHLVPSPMQVLIEETPSFSHFFRYICAIICSIFTVFFRIIYAIICSIFTVLIIMYQVLIKRILKSVSLFFRDICAIIGIVVMVSQIRSICTKMGISFRRGKFLLAVALILLLVDLSQGQGGFGAAYKGVLQDGREIAVKRLFFNNSGTTEGLVYLHPFHFCRGYMAPEYLAHGQLTEKADVYSFGVLSLEVVTGRQNNRSKTSEYSVEHKNLQNMVRMHPSMYEDNNILNRQSSEPIRSSKRVPLVKSSLCPCCKSLSTPCKKGVENKPSKERDPTEVEPSKEPGPTSVEPSKEPGPTVVEPLTPDMRTAPSIYKPRVGRLFQAKVPAWTCVVFESDSKWLGTRVWPPQDEHKNVARNGMGPIGNGRESSCLCRLPGSTDCVRFHIAENRIKLSRELGPVFHRWKFNHMGEEVSLSWTIEEEKKFKLMVKSNTNSINKFWRNAFKFFPRKNREKLVSYYFNVYVIRRRSYQNRVTPNEIDSDDDEAEVGSIGDSFGYEKIHPPRIKCSQNMQFKDFDYNM